MKLLITGGSGQLGSSLIENAKSQHEIISPSRKDFDIEDKLEFQDLLKYHSPDIVINCAAMTDTILCEKQPLEAFRYNCIAVKNMAKICNEFDIPFVTFSTDYIFDGKTDRSYIEGDIPNPLNIYGLSKLSGEYASLIYDTTTIIRTSGLYGLNSEFTKGGKGNFIDNRISDSKSKNSIEIDCSQTISPTYVENLSKAILKLIEYPKYYNIYHFVNEGHCSWYELTKEIYTIMNINTNLIPVERSSTEILRPKFSALKNTKGREYGIILPHWKDALRNYLKLKYGTK